jgi:hypothetical protein
MRRLTMPEEACGKALCRHRRRARRELEESTGYCGRKEAGRSSHFRLPGPVVDEDHLAGLEQRDDQGRQAKSDLG